MYFQILSRLQESLSFSKRRSEYFIDENQKREFCDTFLLELSQILFASIGIESCNHRRVAGLHCMNLLFSTFPDVMEISVKSEEIETLIDLLEDSQDVTKKNSLSILKLICRNGKTNVISVEQTSDLWTKAKLLCESPNPNHSASAGYLLMFLLDTAEFSVLLNKSKPDLIFHVLEELLAALSQKDSQFTRLETENPLFGHLSCMRRVLDICRDLQDLSPLRKFATKTIETCFQIHKVTSDILQSDAPEGVSCDNFGSFCSQSLLLYAWRSCKEVSLLLADLVNLVPHEEIHFDQTILAKSQILSILNFFVRVLSSTIHRGAFEQAFIGFGSLCRWLWKSKDSELKNSILQLLSEILEEVKEKEFCVTRRGAGLPYLIQGIVVSESPLNFDRVSDTMKRLISASQSERQTVRTQSHNILRSLFQNAELGDSVLSFAGQGFKIAIKGFKSHIWAVSIDPRGRPTFSDLSSVRPVPSIQNLTKQNNFQVKIVIGSG